MMCHPAVSSTRAGTVSAIVLAFLSACSAANVRAQVETGSASTRDGDDRRPAATGAARPSAPHRALALYWYGKDYPSNVVFDRALQAALQTAPEAVEYYAEYLESNRFPGEDQAQNLRDYLRAKYERQIDVVLAVSPPPLNFLLDYRASLFSTTPIVFYTSAGLPARPDADMAEIVGIFTPDAYAKTLDLALALHPETRQVFIVSGTPDREGLIEDNVRQQMAGFESRIELAYLTDLPLDTLLATVRSLPRESVILYARQSQDEPGRALSPIDFLKLMEHAAPVPIYSPGETYVGNGTVGGHVVDVAAGAVKTAEIALQLVGGSRLPDAPLARVPTVATFDARQLKRWGIPEDRLPPGSVILFGQQTIWAQHPGYVAVTGIVLLVQTLLIGG